MRTRCSILLILILLLACAPIPPQKQLLPPPSIMIQCRDGSIAERVEYCPSIQQEPIPQIETKPIEQETPVREKTIMQELLENAPNAYWFSDESYGAIVVGDKRSTGEYNPWFVYYLAITYWNVKDKVVYLQAGRPIPDTWWQKHITGKEVRGGGLNIKYHTPFFKLELTGDKKIDQTRIPKEFNKFYYGTKESELVRLFESFYTKSPIDRMKEYENEIPIRVDTVPIMLPFSRVSALSNLAIYYKKKDKPDQTIVFRIDPEFKLALIIDELQGSTFLKRTSYFFDTVYEKEGKRRVPITEKLVSLPDDYIIITPKDYQAFIDELESRY